MTRKVTKKVKVEGRLISQIGDEFGAVDPRPFSTLIPGAMITTDKLNGDELTIPPDTILTESPGDDLTVVEVDDLIAGNQDLRLLYIERTGWRGPVYAIDRGDVTKAWRRLRPMYLLEDGYPPYGYAATALFARLWLGDGPTTLVFEVRC